MGNPVLLLRLAGPLQAWGTRSRWDVRDTGLEPTKSGIIGLLGCALGYPMYDPRLETISNDLRFGVRVDHPGSIVSDYQTITDFLPSADGGYKFRGGTASVLGPPAKMLAEGKAPATIISPRLYLEDASFLVALESKSDSPTLRDCAAAVQQPKWPLFLGRKACVPTRPIFDRFGSDYDSIGHALEKHPWEWLGACKQQRPQRPKDRLVAFIEDESGSLTRQDAILTNQSRTYGFRSARCQYFDAVVPQVDSVQPETV